MTIKEIKQAMLQYKDFYGGDIPDTEAIEKAKSKKELAALLNNHSYRLEDMLADAQSHLRSFKQKLGLTGL